MTNCPNCGEPAVERLIDCRARLGTPERELRYCYGCRPEATVAGQRIFVVDRHQSYSMTERLIDLHGANPKIVM